MNYRIAVVGSGAIGCYYGGKLAAAGGDVHFLVRGNVAQAQRDGLRINGPDEDVHVQKLNVYASTREIGPCHLVLIALKATANDQLLDLVPPLLREDTVLMTLQNGLGNEELLADNFGPQRVMAGLCFICLSRVLPTTVVRYDHGHMALGEFNRSPLSRTRAVAGLFKEAGIRCHVVENLALERWRKLVWNIPFNALSILAGGIDTAAILADAALRETTKATMQEVIVAANACGFALDKSAAAEQIERTYSMGAYKPSTLLDFEAGKPLEIEPIWGEPLRRARTAGANVPRMQVLYSLLKHVDLVRQDATKSGNR